MRTKSSASVWSKTAEERSLWARVLWLFRRFKAQPARRSTYVAPGRETDAG